MMADVSGFSRMMGADEEATVDQIKEFHRHVKALVEQFEGRVVDTAGDSVLGEFDSVVNAVRCACRIQEEQAEENAGRRPEERIQTRIGIHLGDVIVEDYRVYGDGVNIAARLEPLADPGGICISEAVFQQIRNKLDLSLEDLGLRELKNIEHPIRLYRVPPVGAPSSAPPPPTDARPRWADSSVVSSETSGESGAGALLRPAALVPLSVAGFLLLSPIILFPSGGALPTAGAILASVVAGRLWARRTGRAGDFLLVLGLGIASGALWTHWSRVTNGLFLLAGLIVAATGAGGRRGRRSPTG
jgi:class 3 adenylate cyclase